MNTRVRAIQWLGQAQRRGQRLRYPITAFIGLLALLVPLVGAAQLAASVLPSSRSVQVGNQATAFATIINAGAGLATACGISPVTGIPATLFYQTTDPLTNQTTGEPDTPADIPAGALQSFVFGFMPTLAFAPVEVELAFDCADVGPALSIPGVNTLLLSASTTPVPDIVALAATPAGTGVTELAKQTGSGVFAVAVVNVGATGAITVTGDTGSAALPVSVFVCETNAVGACLAAPAASVATTIAAGATPTFGIFPLGSEKVEFDPGGKRVFVRFRDAGGETRGATSVAVKTSLADIAFPTGGGIELPPGSVPDGTTIEVSVTDAPLLPAGLSAVGQALQITSDAEPSRPVVLRFPIPPGKALESLFIFRVEDDGTVTQLARRVEGTELVAETPGFSRALVAELLGRDEDEPIPIERRSISGPPAIGFNEEWVYQLLRQTSGSAVQRLQTAPDTVWRIFGVSRLLDYTAQPVQTTKRAGHVIVKGGETEELATLTADYRDRATGISGFASFNISILSPQNIDEAQDRLRVVLYPARTTLVLGVESFFDGNASIAELEQAGIGPTDPIRWEWSFGDGTIGDSLKTEFDLVPGIRDSTTRFELPRHEYTAPGSYRVSVVANHVASGRTGEVVMTVAVLPDDLRATLSGPDREPLVWSVADDSVLAVFQLKIEGGVAPYTTGWQVFPASAATVGFSGGDSAAFNFNEPGSYLVKAEVTDGQPELTDSRLPVTVTGGFPLAVTIEDLPASTKANTGVAATLRIQGGLRVVAGARRGYNVTVDWGDRSATTLEDAGNEGPYGEHTVTLSHTYTAPSPTDTPYIVTVSVTDATGKKTEPVTRPITVEEAAECQIEFYFTLGTPGEGDNTIMLSGTDPAFPLITWTRQNADDIIVEEDEHSEVIYHLTGAIPRTIRYGDYSQPGTSRGSLVFLENAPALQLNRHYFIYIEESGTLGDRFGVEITGTTCDP